MAQVCRWHKAFVNEWDCGWSTPFYCDSEVREYVGSGNSSLRADLTCSLIHEQPVVSSLSWHKCIAVTHPLFATGHLLCRISYVLSVYRDIRWDCSCNSWISGLLEQVWGPVYLCKQEFNGYRDQFDQLGCVENSLSTSYMTVLLAKIAVV